MDKIHLAYLRDIAIEYLPAAQKNREQAKKYWVSSETYGHILYATAMYTSTAPTSTAVELAAAQLLTALETWGGYDPNSPELREFDPQDLRNIAMRLIADAVTALSDVTGMEIPFNYMASLEAAPDTGKPADAPASRQPHKKGERWTDDDLRYLFEACQSGKTHDELAALHGVTRQLIGAQIKRATELFGIRKSVDLSLAGLARNVTFDTKK